MALNRKLRPPLAGRKVKNATHANDKLTLSFDDGSQTHVRIGATPESLGGMKGREIESVRQAGDEMNLDFAEGTSAKIKLAGPTSSVMLRDRDNNLEYAD